MNERHVLDRLDELICAARVVGRTEEGSRSEALFTLYREIATMVERLPLSGDDVCPYTFSHTRHWCGYRGCRDG